ncbi:hypothetical protein MPSEU_000501700 [Mayamaea pseudoterrestris]|nr:hypothetical protein MPSEU_000501700 [Mayamaea pseudoterrestris]
MWSLQIILILCCNTAVALQLPRATNRARTSSPPPRRAFVACVPRFATSEEPDSLVDASLSVEPIVFDKNESQFIDIPFETDEEKTTAIGNLVADDAWEGLSLELSEIIRRAVLEDIKSNAREFLGKEDYQVGDLSKEIDTRVKSEVASLRNKESYELGDLVFAMDEMSKNLTEQLTGKPYETGDLSIELDKRIKKAVAGFCGADEYQFGMLTAEIAKRVDESVTEFLGKPYEFGDVSRAVENRRKDWVKSFLGDEAAEKYQFGDLTKKMINNYTGKSDYKFGDLSKKVFGNLFNKDKKA